MQIILDFKLNNNFYNFLRVKTEEKIKKKEIIPKIEQTTQIIEALKPNQDELKPNQDEFNQIDKNIPSFCNEVKHVNDYTNLVRNSLMMQKFNHQIIQNQLMYYNSIAFNHQRQLQNNIYLNMIFQKYRVSSLYRYEKRILNNNIQ